MIDIDDQIIGGASLDMMKLASYAEKLASQWDGNEPGTLEDIAHICNEISEKCLEVNKLLNELDKYV